MSAIAGLLKLSGERVDPEEVCHLIRPSRLRGVDDPSVWCEDCIGLAIQADVSDEGDMFRDTSVLQHPTGAAVFDGRVDDRPSLARRIGVAREEADRLSDGRFLLAAYGRWGDDFAERLVGDFAAAVWDRREGCLILSRDCVGQRPLYYALRKGEWLVFGTEVRNVLAHPCVVRRWDAVMVVRYLDLSFVRESGRTFFSAVRRVPAATTLRVDMSGQAPRLWRYWRPAANGGGVSGKGDDLGEEFRAHFCEAIRSRLTRSRGPVATSLSGGLDSTSVSCVARDLLAAEDREIHSFSVVFSSESPSVDERDFLSATLDTGGFVSHMISARDDGPFADLDQQMGILGQPFGGPAIFVHRLAYAAANGDGMRTMLDGVGGDAVASDGFEWLFDYVLRGAWSELTAELTQVARRWGVDRHALSQQVGGMLGELVQQRPMRSWSEPLAVRLVRDDVRDEAARTPRTSALVTGPPRSAAEAQLVALLGGEMQMYAELQDPVAARCGIATSSPFLDKRLIEFCLRLPREWRIRDGWTRFVLRQSLGGILPEQVRWRQTKSDLNRAFFMGFGPIEAARLHGDLEKLHRLDEIFEMGRLRATLTRLAGRRRLTREEQWCVYLVRLLGEWVVRECL